MQEMQDIERRLRIIEDRLNILRQLIENLEVNFVEKDKEVEMKINQINNEISGLRKDIQELNLKVNAILDQLPLFATNDRVKVIERYLDLINPFDFLTKKEAIELINKIVENKVKEMLKNEEKSII
ncbi:MAG TPA: hypothetical protein EYH09_02130 [Candidatus Nanopusillus sp.]|nr:hypothetical protein [Candidatus Nanopusillus sp.]HIP90365.1 hypothetical protein [Candidatus Nanopusillus sp.]